VGRFLISVATIVVLIVSAQGSRGQQSVVTPKGMIEPEAFSVKLPKTKTLIDGTPSIVPSFVTVPLVPNDEFKSLKLDRIICAAMGRFFQASGNEYLECIKSKPAFFVADGVKVTILSAQAESKICEFELFGKSANLALKNSAWVERHRIFAQLSLTGSDILSVLLSVHQPMLRTTAELEPLSEELFQPFEPKHEATLRVFQSRISEVVRRLLEERYGGALK
jgi:hypothetical protein